MSTQAKLNVLMVQAQLRWKEPAANRDHLASLLGQASEPFDLALFPETFTTGFLGDTDLPEEDMTGPTVQWMQQMAEQHQAAMAGSAVIVEQGQRFNRLIFVTPEGDVWHYDKRHLFAFGGENKRYVAGQKRLVWNWRGWRINPQVCYDLRFPAWCRNRNDFDFQIYVANWPEKRVAHWIALLQARAIENQAYVIGINRVGEDGNGLAYPGRSQAFDPLGRSLADLPASEQIQLIRIELEQVGEVRRQFPFQADADPFTLQQS
ncbi:MAG TPA: amidohydrolase [Xanthomonadales bacterium]|nr:amidohydrolase [Xanthomonadales bacterium]